MDMQAATRAITGGLILYDAAQGGKVHEHVFAPSYWRAREALSEPLGGRGAAWRIQDEGIDWVLRFYRRGGLPGKLILDRYFYTGVESSRPWREWRMLATLLERGLPVPRPVAARIMRSGFSYRGALITETVPGESLARLVRENTVAESIWKSIGRTIRRFHDAGAWHADLNAHNILVADDGPESSVHLIDFDRGRMRSQDTKWREANLARLLRSLNKVAPERETAITSGWAMLKAGYRG
jgi:3-deoxy-D-manno-octulosonic acid kinase